MVFPFWNNCNCGAGYYMPRIICDTVSSNPVDTMNLFMNQAYMDSTVRPMLFMTPQYNFGNFSPYGDSFNNSYLCNPMYTLAQMSWGTPAWNNGGLFGSFNNGNWFGNFGQWGGANNPDSSGSSSNRATDAEKRRYEKLKTFAQQLVNYQDFTGEEKDNLEVAIKNNKGTLQERYDALLEALKTVDVEIVQDFLVEGADKLGVNDNIKGNKNNAKSFYNRLLSTGFEYNTELDGMIVDFYNAVTHISDNDSNLDHVDIVAYVEDQTCDILDVISSWNSQHDGSSGVTMINHIAKSMQKIRDPQQKEKPKQYINRIANAMIKKANTLQGDIAPESMKTIKEISKKLQDEIKKSSPNYKNVSAYFDELYVMTRLASVAIVTKDANAYYGEIDNDFFKDSFRVFRSETIADLQSEGFSAEYIQAHEVQLKEKTRRHSTPDDSEEPEETPLPPVEPENVPEGDDGDSEEASQAAEEAVNCARIITLLCGWTGEEEAKEIAGRLDSITADNVLLLLNKYYKGATIEGILEKLDDDCGDKVSLDQKYNLIEAILEKAKQLGLENDENYKTLAGLLNDHRKLPFEVTNLSQSYKYKPVRWLGFGTTYGEEMDKYIKKLHKKMKMNAEQAQ